MKVLVTGGAGYIGSHTCLELLRSGHEVSVVDSLYNGSKEALTRVQRLSNRIIEFSQCDVRDAQALNMVFVIVIMLLLANLLIAFMADAYETIKAEAEARWCYQLYHFIQDRKLQRNLKKTLRQGDIPLCAAWRFDDPA